MAKKVTAGRDQLGDFAPKFGELNDDVLFGQVWSREDKLSAKQRSIVTVTALMASGILDSSLQHHLMTAKANGVTRTEIAEIITHAAFYAGWPKGWAVFRMAKEIWAEEDAYDGYQTVFPIGGPLPDQYAPYFIGQAYLNPLTTQGVRISNVTFEPGCRNNWHIHHIGGQQLLCLSGRGWYQEWGQEPQLLQAGDAVEIPPEVKHWHGAAADSWFTHLAVAIPAEGASDEWLEPVGDDIYPKD